MKNLWLREVATYEMLHSRPGPSRSPLWTDKRTAATATATPSANPLHAEPLRYVPGTNGEPRDSLLIHRRSLKGHTRTPESSVNGI
jgi:hypothetical protein